MKYVVFAAIIVSMTSFKNIKNINADKIIGKWIANEGKNVIVLVYKHGTEFKAKLFGLMIVMIKPGQWQQGMIIKILTKICVAGS